MMQVGVRKAKNDLSKLIEAALNGEQVVITNRGKPSVRLVPEAPKPAKNRGIGCLKDLPDVKFYPGWDSPERDAEFTALFEAEAKRNDAFWEEFYKNKRSKKPKKK
jgi:prevent-host-death family protein